MCNPKVPCIVSNLVISQTEVNDEVGVHVIHQGVGNISPSDIENANTANAAVIGFNVSVPGSVAQQAKLKEVSVYRHQVCEP